jgi:rRNA maturation endonuclease Nob1
MASCTSCGNDITGKKFCPECGTPVQPIGSAESKSASTNVCPRCNGAVNPGAAFCTHCGSSLISQTAVATATPTSPQPLTRQCIACHAEVPIEMAFCTNCGQSMQVSATPTPAASAPQAFVLCSNCGRQNKPGVNFCAGCGGPIAQNAGTPMPQMGYMQSPQPSQPYAQYPQQAPQFNAQYPQQYGQQPQQYGQMAYQQPMILRCPICMAMSPMGTSNCPSCRTSLAGVVPTPANIQMQGQQSGLGGIMQGPGGNMAMGALGGAAAVIGGEILLHEVERGFEGDRGYGHREGDGLLGGLGDLANDIGLF